MWIRLSIFKIFNFKYLLLKFIIQHFLGATSVSQIFFCQCVKNQYFESLLKNRNYEKTTATSTPGGL